MKKNSRRMLIAIDGPAAAGKGTLARTIAHALKLPYLDTGLLYRAVARKVLDKGVDPQLHSAEEQARHLKEDDLKRHDLRTSEVDIAASLVAAQPLVRQALMGFQQKFAQERGGVLDGRDIGTMICPNADVKLYITASAQTRARRRWLQNGGQLGDPQEKAGILHLLREIEERDSYDRNRTNSPLRKADDAQTIETDDLTPEQVFQKAMAIITSHLQQDP
ncbi:(d)CMP kinase [Entomobacter blattae]|uniref:Cytidylate kinase n=1 Tax=Entomobacter blattae TaxID=2762277 RepID=A0A7H1NTI3_9PROT|nr:(d)CMP kinase [Entomobacter blattae]QNT79093.1 Cytidylate kinase [Entomobacter blattae]